MGTFGVVKTDLWLEADFHDPEKICKRLSQDFFDDRSDKIYHYLSQFGMYRPSRQTYEHFINLKEQNYWEKAERIFQKYKRAWNGPDIPIYIFPLAARHTIFSKMETNKSGVAFRDKLFLFISPLDDENELEALIIHEYHHTCRLHKQKKKIENLTLLDSMVLEGLAEHAVQENCGKEYNANWCDYYSDKEIMHFWTKFLKEQNNIKKVNRLHDEILYGRGRFPKMIGYAAGFVIVSMYKKKKKLSIHDTFVLPSEAFVPSLSKDEGRG